VQGSWHHQGKFWDGCLKKLGILGDAKIFPAHRTGWGGQSSPTGVLKMLASA
jgi:hypothetical protein